MANNRYFRLMERQTIKGNCPGEVFDLDPFKSLEVHIHALPSSTAADQHSAVNEQGSHDTQRDTVAPSTETVNIQTGRSGPA